MIHVNNSYLNFSHSGDMGDIIYALPIIKHLGPGNLTLSPSTVSLKKKLEKYNAEYSITKSDGTLSGIDKEKFAFVKKLLKFQPYIKKLTHKPVTEKINLDDFRLHRTTNGICEKYVKTFKVPYDIYESPWLLVEPKFVSPIVVARSPRYQNSHFPWSQILKKYPDIIFVGLKIEHTNFCKEVKKIPFYETKTAWDLACVIGGSKLFIGNQSLPYAIAESLKVNTIQETYERVPDCLFPRSNATYFFNRKYVAFRYLNLI